MKKVFIAALAAVVVIFALLVVLDVFKPEGGGECFLGCMESKEFFILGSEMPGTSPAFFLEACLYFFS